MYYNHIHLHIFWCLIIIHNQNTKSKRLTWSAAFLKYRFMFRGNNRTWNTAEKNYSLMATHIFLYGENVWRGCEWFDWPCSTASYLFYYLFWMEGIDESVLVFFGFLLRAPVFVLHQLLRFTNTLTLYTLHIHIYTFSPLTTTRLDKTKQWVCISLSIYEYKYIYSLNCISPRFFKF